jgi:hypothetical protein
MGVYVYKTTAKTVQLENGDLATVAVYAYKPSFNFDSTAVDDRAAAQAHKRHEWVVLGHVNYDGKVEVEMGSTAVKIGRRGTFSDYFFDKRADEGAETSKVVCPTGTSVTLVERVNEDLGQDENGFTLVKETLFHITGKRMKRKLHSTRTYRIY